MRSAVADESGSSTTGPLLSVILPIHNVEPWLDETLLSLSDQEFEDFEVVAVNDHSTDRSGEILAAHAARDSRIRVIEPEAAGGARARNTAVAAARGKYLAFADADDIVPRGAYAAMVESLESTGSDIAFGPYVKFNGTRTWRPTERWPAFDEPRRGVRLADHPSLMRGRACWNKVYRRDFWLSHGITFPEVPRSNDIQPVTRACLAASRVDVVTTCVYVYRQRPGVTSMSSRASAETSLLSYLEQELACATAMAATGEPELLNLFTSLFVLSDGWVHLAAFAASMAPGEELPAEASRLVREILDLLPPERLARLDHAKVIGLRLVAMADGSAAALLASDHAVNAPASAQRNLARLHASVHAASTLAPLVEDDRSLGELWSVGIAGVLLGTEPLGTASDVLAAVSALKRTVAQMSADGRMPDVPKLTAILELDEAGSSAWSEARAHSAYAVSSVTHDGTSLVMTGVGTEPFPGAAVHLAFRRRGAQSIEGPRVEFLHGADGWTATVGVGAMPAERTMMVGFTARIGDARARMLLEVTPDTALPESDERTRLQAGVHDDRGVATLTVRQADRAWRRLSRRLRRGVGRRIKRILA